uniref:Uncharacterized protein n=1 Tax=Daucus carota subsp. sativus TaxID=79200 RepID=A0A162A454_DAUCS
MSFSAHTLPSPPHPPPLATPPSLSHILISHHHSRSKLFYICSSPIQLAVLLKVMSSDRMESIQGLNLRYMVCQFNTHQMEAPEQDVHVSFTAPTHGDGPIVPIDTEKLLIEKQQCQAELPAQVASTSSMPPINRDVNHENGVVNVAGATGELLARKRKNQVEVPSQDAYDHANGVAYVSGAIVPADTENMLFEKQRRQAALPPQDATIGFTAPITRGVNHAYGVADVAGVTVPASTENLLYRYCRHRVEEPAQDACTGFTAPISRDVNHATGVAEVAGASADIEKLPFEKHRQYWEFAESFEAFKKMPQNPHFRPLKFCKEILNDHANGVAYVSGAIVPADTENMLFEKQRRQAALPPQDATIGFTAPITRGVNHAYGVADVAGVTVPASTENLLYRYCRHRVEEPAQDACTGFTAPISRDVNHATGVAEVAGASADIEKLPFEKHRQYWEFAESFEAFKKMPQNPHFRPLKFCKEILSEGQALARMVTYNNIVRKISNFNMDTKGEEMMDELSLLEDLDAHGFKVQMLKDRLNKLLIFKSEEEKLKNMLERREMVLSVHVEESRIFKGTRAKGEARVQELWKEVASIQKEEEYIHTKKANLQLVEDANSEKCGRINMQIKEHIASPLW